MSLSTVILSRPLQVRRRVARTAATMSPQLACGGKSTSCTASSQGSPGDPAKHLPSRLSQLLCAYPSAGGFLRRQPSSSSGFPIAADR